MFRQDDITEFSTNLLVTANCGTANSNGTSFFSNTQESCVSLY
jgi:hypothetical protein